VFYAATVDGAGACGTRAELARRREASSPCAPEHLAPDGAVHLLMPRLDQARYPELAQWSIHVAASRWYPLLGRTDLLVLRPR
jgi:hypothetical protein